ncbi:MAG: cupin domain-containing protein [Labrys sp. (in: a-proteobacteria)]
MLRPGDSFAFDSREPHRVANLGTVDAVIIWAQTPPLI